MAESNVHEGTKERSGAAVAAFLAAALGLLALALAQIQSERSEAFGETMQSLGSLWIPNAEGIGPYSGKETVFLAVWLVSWGLLHVLLRRRDVDVKKWFGATLAVLVIATLLIWPPVWELFV